MSEDNILYESGIKDLNNFGRYVKGIKPSEWFWMVITILGSVGLYLTVPLIFWVSISSVNVMSVLVMHDLSRYSNKIRWNKLEHPILLLTIYPMWLVFVALFSCMLGLVGEPISYINKHIPKFNAWFDNLFINQPKIKVSFDFDGCLEINAVQEYAKALVDEGIDVWVVTTRLSEADYIGSDPNKDLNQVLKYVGIPTKNVVYLGDRRDKYQYFKEHGDFKWHLDDDWDDVNKINEYTTVAAITNFGNEKWKKSCNLQLIC